METKYVEIQTRQMETVDKTVNNIILTPMGVNCAIMAPIARIIIMTNLMIKYAIILLIFKLHKLYQGDNN